MWTSLNDDDDDDDDDDNDDDDEDDDDVVVVLLTAASCDRASEFRCQYLYQCLPLPSVDNSTEECLDRSDEGLPLSVYSIPLVNIVLPDI